MYYIINEHLSPKTYVTYYFKLTDTDNNNIFTICISCIIHFSHKTKQEVKSSMIREYSLIILQIFVFWTINQLGYFIVKILNIPLPGNVMAMIILFILLVTNIIPLAYIEKAGNLLIKHLGFFFIPIAVGLINYEALILQQGIVLGIGLVLSAIIGITLTGYISQALDKRKEDTVHEHHNAS